MSEQFAAVRRGLDEYRLHAVLGQGAYGVVLAATKLNMDRRVAIKSLRSEHAHRLEVRRRFATEAKVLGSFRHPHIVDVYDYREDEDYCALIMERLEGGTLRERFGPWPLAPATACAVGTVVCSALQYAHQHGVLHRDIKPTNLLFDGDDVLKLTDFGIAKMVEVGDQPTVAGTMLGTASYMAPEQIEGVLPPAPTVDVYGVATLLYEMLAGRLPFSSEGGPFAVAQRHLNTTPTTLRDVAPGVPESLADVVMRGLARDPADRQSSAEQFGVAIARAARAGFGDHWLEQAAVQLLAPGQILDAALGRRSRIPEERVHRSDSAQPVDPVPEPPTYVGSPPSGELDGASLTVGGVEEPPTYVGPPDVPTDYAGDDEGFDVGDLEPDPRGTGDDTSEPTDGMVTLAPEHPPPPPPPIWLWAAAAVVVVIVLVVVVLIVRSLASSSGTADDSSSAAASFTCWDGATRLTLAACGTPTGDAELRWMFLSITDACNHKGLAADGLRQVVLCSFRGGDSHGYVRYSVWDHHSDAYQHYLTDFDADPTTKTLNGDKVLEWGSDVPRATGRYPYKVAALSVALPISVTVYATTQEGVGYALDQVVRMRPVSELHGVANGG